MAVATNLSALGTTGRKQVLSQFVDDDSCHYLRCAVLGRGHHLSLHATLQHESLFSQPIMLPLMLSTAPGHKKLSVDGCRPLTIATLKFPLRRDVSCLSCWLW